MIALNILICKQSLLAYVMGSKLVILGDKLIPHRKSLQWVYSNYKALGLMTIPYIEIMGSLDQPYKFQSNNLSIYLQSTSRFLLIARSHTPILITSHHSSFPATKSAMPAEGLGMLPHIWTSSWWHRETGTPGKTEWRSNISHWRSEYGSYPHLRYWQLVKWTWKFG